MLEIITDWGWQFVQGTFVIVAVFLVSLVLTVIFGLVGAAAKLSGRPWRVRLANAYTVLFRGTPEFLILLLVYFGSASSLTWIAQAFDPGIKFVDISPFWTGSFVISLIVGAAATETFRGAFLGVGIGQMEAAYVLGLSRWQAFALVRFPQMWRLALPSLGNHLTSLVKDTSLISLIGLQEIMFTAEMASSVTSRPFEIYLLVSLIYLAFTTLVGVTMGWLEKRANSHLARG
ncbi:nopaline transport system permease protein NocQ [Labrys miyagiensis]